MAPPNERDHDDGEEERIARDPEERRLSAALYEELSELGERRQNIRRVGFSRGGKAALFRIARYALILAVIVIAFVWGSHFGAGR